MKMKLPFQDVPFQDFPSQDVSSQESPVQSGETYCQSTFIEGSSRPKEGIAKVQGSPTHGDEPYKAFVNFTASDPSAILPDN